MISSSRLQNSLKNISDIFLKYSTYIFSKTVVYALLLLPIRLSSIEPVGVTYELNGGRFGDNLLAYIHAKWASFQYGIPLLYRPFPYSEELRLEKYDERLQGNRDKKFFYRSILKKGDLLENFFLSDQTKSTLYIIPYFPESEWELELEHNYPYFKVDWDNLEFVSLLKKMIAPRRKIPRFCLPKDKISVALHIRTGDGFDDLATIHHFTLKFPPIHFYIKQLQRLVQLFENEQLYVHVFSDAFEIRKIVSEIQSHFDPEKVQFGFRNEGNEWVRNVIEDFFALTQFQASIHGESNFAFCAGAIADYLIEIIPKNSLLDEVVVKGKDQDVIEKFTHLLNN